MGIHLENYPQTATDHLDSAGLSILCSASFVALKRYLACRRAESSLEYNEFPSLGHSGRLIYYICESTFAEEEIMSAVPLTDSLADIAERKRNMFVLLKHVGMSGVYLCAVIALSTIAFLGSKYYLNKMTKDIAAPQSIATNFSHE